jgi:hypothetical protein
MEIAFSGRVFQWRGPAPYYYVAVPEDDSADIKADEPILSYGWGCIPVSATIGRTEFTTSLFPKDGLYLLPLKVAVRRAEGIDDGDHIDVRMSLQPIG